MSIVKRKKILLGLLLCVHLVIPNQAFAAFNLADQDSLTQAVVQQSGVSQQSVPTIVGNLAKGIFAVMGLMFFILVFYGGFIWISARGNEDQIEKSQKTITAAFIGLIIVLASYAITAYLQRIIS